MTLTVTDLEVEDIRFPTSEELDGSDAMNPDPDYSAAYVVLRTDGGEEGHGFCFTIGRGNDVMAAAIGTLRSHVVGRPAPAPPLTWPPSTTCSPTTRSCAGSAPRRA